MRERWLHCIGWRVLFVLVLGPCIFALPIYALGELNAANSTYLLSVSVSGAVGLAYWADSPLRLRRRVVVACCAAFR